MANVYTASIGLRGYDANVSVINYDLGTFDLGTPEANYTAAVGALDDIRGALVDITEADLAFVRLTEQVQQFDTIPTSEDARVHERAAVVTHLNAPGTVGKYHTIYIPAPIDALFMGDEGDGESVNVVDINNALLQQYVQQIADHAFVSDGEQIDTTSGAGGIKSGRRVSRPIRKPGL